MLNYQRVLLTRHAELLSFTATLNFSGTASAARRDDRRARRRGLCEPRAARARDVAVGQGGDAQRGALLGDVGDLGSFDASNLEPKSSKSSNIKLIQQKFNKITLFCDLDPLLSFISIFRGNSSMLDAILFKNLSDAAPCPVLRYLVAAERRQTDATDTTAAMDQRRQRQHLHWQRPTISPDEWNCATFANEIISIIMAVSSYKLENND